MAAAVATPRSGDDTRSRMFQCRVCMRSFAKNEHLVRHVRSHTQERPYKCPDCGKRYNRHDILVRHQRHVKCKSANSGTRSPAHVTAHGANALPSETDRETAAPGAIASPEDSQRHGPSSCSALTNSANHTSGLTPAQIGPASLEAVDAATALNPSRSNGVMSDANFENGVDASSSSLLDSMDHFQWWNVNADLHDDIWGSVDLTDLEDGLSGLEVPSLPTINSELERAKSVQRVWFTSVPDAPARILYPQRHAGIISEDATEPDSPNPANTEIDDLYRQKLQKRLQILCDEPTVPSAELLNISIRLYFTKAHPIFPVIHAPTFRPNKKNRSLLIGMAALGSLYTGSDHGLRQGIHLFERIHKSTLLNWEQLTAKNHDTMISIIQCALLSQIFGLLSGSPNLLLTVDAFHGPPIAWARQMGLHNFRPIVAPEADFEGTRLDDTWKAWARNEELIRLAHGLYIVDVEIASILHHEPLVNFESYDLSLSSSDRAFMAPNARHWKDIYLAELSQRQSRLVAVSTRQFWSSGVSLRELPLSSYFSAYAILEGVNMEILMRRNTNSTAWGSYNNHREFLIDFHRHVVHGISQVTQDALQLRILLHTACMAAHADFNLLERAVGREGSTVSAEEQARVTDWANSQGARRCVLHGLWIKRYVQALGMTSELAIHVPRSLFWAGIAMSCFLLFAWPENLSYSLLRAELMNEDAPLVGIESSSLLSDLNQSGVCDRLSLKMMLCVVTDLLQHSGRWEVARRYAAILAVIGGFS